MEAAGAPRLDVERPPQRGWSAAQRGALVSVGRRGGTRAGCSFPPMPSRRPRNEARGAPAPWDPSQLRARDAGVLSSSSDPS
jgi:hypothetical protein